MGEWSRLSDTEKLIVGGAGLLAVVGVSYFIYKATSAAGDALSPLTSGAGDLLSSGGDFVDWATDAFDSAAEILTLGFW